MKQSVCKNGLFSTSCFTDGREAECTFGMVKRRFAPWRLYSSAECASLGGLDSLLLMVCSSVTLAKTNDY